MGLYTSQLMICRVAYVWHVFSAPNQSLSFSSSRSQEGKVATSDVAHRPMSDADVDSVSERVGEFTVWFDDFTRFDQQLHLLIDLNIFTDGDEQLLLLLKVTHIFCAVSLFTTKSLGMEASIFGACPKPG